MSDERNQPAPAGRPEGAPHPALARIARLAADWRLPRVMEDEPASFERTRDDLAGEPGT